MYKNTKNNYNHNNRHGNNFSGSRPRFNQGFKRAIKKLDHNLFIRKTNDLDEKIHNEFLEKSAKGSFSDFAITEKLKRNIKDHGYEVPTEIQNKAMPEILSGHDVIAIANTGTGKTAAFLISLINKSCLDRNQRVLIVVPTRELAVQIKDEYQIFAKGTELEAVALIGGANIKRQTYSLKHNPHFVIGTPGRLKDLIGRKELNLSQFQNVVLDEVDKMVDIGFIHDIKYIVSLLPKNRQSLFFSATVSGKTREILQSFVNNPVTISVKQQETINNIDQDIVKVLNGQSKTDVLHNLLAQPTFDKVIIFGRTKWGIQKLTNELVKRGFKAVAIHGNKSQNQRQMALRQFKNNEIQILLATDVASRGLDIDNVTHVINYDAPESYDDYIHRIGRTGRAGKKGKALTFID
jgi:ATP-dependent RNA helicase RhlE